MSHPFPFHALDIHLKVVIYMFSRINSVNFATLIECLAYALCQGLGSTKKVYATLYSKTDVVGFHIESFEYRV